MDVQIGEAGYEVFAGAVNLQRVLWRWNGSGGADSRDFPVLDQHGLVGKDFFAGHGNDVDVRKNYGSGRIGCRIGFSGWGGKQQKRPERQQQVEGRSYWVM